MDVNNTKYHLIYGERDWLPLLLDSGSVDIWWDRERQSMSLAPIVQQLDDLAQHTFLTQDHRRGAAFDHYGNIYWINETEDEIHFHPAATPLETGSFWHVDCLTDKAPQNKQHGDFKTASQEHVSIKPILKGLTVSSHEYLVVGTVQPSGILVFDLHAGGPPVWLCWPVQIPFVPYDFSCSPDGGVWILDRDIDTHQAKMWHLDKHFRVLDCSGDSVELLTPFSNDFYTSTLFSDESDSSSDNNRFLSGLSINVGSPVITSDPVAIEALSENRVMVLNAAPGDESSTIDYFVDGFLVDSVTLDEQVTGGLLGEPTLLAHDFAFVSDSSDTQRTVTGCLYVVVTHAQQSYQFALRATENTLQLVLQPMLLPMRAYSGKALIASGKNAYYDFDNRWLPLAEQPRQRYQSQASIDGIIKDGDEPDCVWHRIIIDACIPVGTRVQFESRTANNQNELVDAPWQQEPDIHLRSEGAELAFYEPFDVEIVNRDISGSWDVLLQNAVGRFIELRILLTGNRRSTPRIHACRVYYPRFSYLQRYLPDVYQTDIDSASFLDRFLGNVEGLYTGLEEKIAHAQSLFDSRTSPPEFLEWLGGWMGAFVDSSWDDARKRLFIQHAVLLFKWRGTVIGLQALLKLSIDSCPDDTIFAPLKAGDDTNSCTDCELDTGNDIRIVEHFLTRRDPGIELAINNALVEPTLLEKGGANTPWQPALGAGVLHGKYQDFLSLTYAGEIDHLNAAWETSHSQFNELTFSPLTPVQTVQQRDWQHFTRDFIGFTYQSVNQDDLWRYQDFLQRRYRQINFLNIAYGLTGHLSEHKFESIELPRVLPHNKQALMDWIEFVSLALPIARQAHKFTVLLPTVLGELPAELERRRAKVEEIVEREKPAHTQFDVKYFWAMFQVGNARLGIDTNIGDGARFVALVLGENFLGQSFLSESHPWSVVDRSIVGRERVSSLLKWRT